MTKEEAINTLIQDKGVDTNKISDGYHTFGELYEHRMELFVALCKEVKNARELLDTGLKATSYGYKKLKLEERYGSVWRSRKHSDGSEFEGWFVLGIGLVTGKQITYHLPNSKWENCDFAETRIMAPQWDGHTSSDVLQRLKNI
jgi:hypothetical protein